jgi:hypothetical protein
MRKIFIQITGLILFYIIILGFVAPYLISYPSNTYVGLGLLSIVLVIYVTVYLFIKIKNKLS